MGSGLALQIKNKYPEVYESYKQGCAMFGSKKESLLGLAQMCKCNDGKIVCNLFGQLAYGRDKQHTDYKALSFALDSLFCGVSEGKYKGKSVAIPYKLGCGTGGGEWNKVLDIIEEFADYYNIEVTIYKLED
jgi:O-acetyl-ADP-ribose deacetylase (regulator of RNase III)